MQRVTKTRQPDHGNQSRTAEEDTKNRSTIRLQPGRESQVRTARSGKANQDRKIRTARSGQLEIGPDSRKPNSWKSDSRTGHAGHDRQNCTGEMEQ